MNYNTYLPPNPQNPSRESQSQQPQQHGPPMFPPSTMYPIGMPLQPPQTNLPGVGIPMGMPMGMNMPMGLPMGMPMGMGMMSQQQQGGQTGLVKGSGPLAGKEAKRGVNGLLEAPREDGPEEHEAAEFMKLSVAEETQYSALWSEASPDSSTISGKDAAAFLGRASGVSKSQLRLIWSIADHLKEGFLDRDGFFIALRLVALAQRGAEIGIAGLRNFKGIVLIPEIKAVPRKEPPTQVQQQQEGGGGGVDGLVGAVEKMKVGRGDGDGDGSFSWWISKEEAQKYDGFFRELHHDGRGAVMGKEGAAFFSKSGLSKKVLRLVWQLSDLEGNGMLDRAEFRTAMHLISSIRQGKLAETMLPGRLDRNGVNWVRVVGESSPAPDGADGSQGGMNAGQNGVSAGSVGNMGQPVKTPVQSPPPPPPSRTENLMDDESHLMQHPANGVAVAGQQHQQQRSTWEENPEELRERLRKEKMDAARAKREMDDMRKEMEKLRKENAQFSNTIRSRDLDTASALSVDSLSPVSSTRGVRSPRKNIAATTANRSTPLSPGLFDSGMNAAELTRRKSKTSSPRTKPRKQAPTEKIHLSSSLAKSQPPPTVVTQKKTTTVVTQKKAPPPRALSKDSLSSSEDDDDDDFWGTGGMAPTRPSLGAAAPPPATGPGNTGGTSPTMMGTGAAASTAQNNTNAAKVENIFPAQNEGFGNDLDDWTF